MKKYLFSICVLFSGGAKLLRCHQCDSNTDINCLLSFDHDQMNQKYLKECPEGTIVCRQILHKTRSHFQRGQSSLKTSYAHDYSLRVVLDCSDYSINKGCIEFTLTLRDY